MKLKAYGSRGSMAFSHRQGLKTGGNTSCFGLDVNGHTVVFDCGSGIMQFHEDMQKKRKEDAAAGRADHGLTFDILLSHLHLDHIIGLSLFDFLFDADNTIRVYTRSRANTPLVDQVLGIFKPPYWPVDYRSLNRAAFVEIIGGETIQLADGVEVKIFDSMHDNATSGFRVFGEGKSVVYLLDYEIGSDEEQFESLAAFCKDADAVVFDATYLPEDYPPRRGWGHSTYEDGMRLAEASACRKMIFSHFFHAYSDETVASIAERAKGGSGRTVYIAAYDGMELEI